MRNTANKGRLPQYVYRAGTCARYVLITQRVCGLIFSQNALRDISLWTRATWSQKLLGKTHLRLILAFIKSVGLWIRFSPLRKGQRIRGNFGRVYKQAYVHRVLKGSNPQYILFYSSNTLYTLRQCRSINRKSKVKGKGKAVPLQA